MKSTFTVLAQASNQSQPKPVVVYSDVEDIEVGREAYYRPFKEKCPKKTSVVIAILPNGVFETEYNRYVPENYSPQASS